MIMFFDKVFERQVRGLGKPGDVFIAISTSSRSSNVPGALQVARQMGITTVRFTGEGDRPITRYCDHYLAVPATSVPCSSKSI